MFYVQKLFNVIFERKYYELDGITLAVTQILKCLTVSMTNITLLKRLSVVSITNITLPSCIVYFVVTFFYFL
jgi:uncharacterized protein YlaN (UPF0358 family)